MITFNGNDIESLYFNEIKENAVYFNGTQVFGNDDVTPPPYRWNWVSDASATTTISSTRPTILSPNTTYYFKLTVPNDYDGTINVSCSSSPVALMSECYASYNSATKIYTLTTPQESVFDNYQGANIFMRTTLGETSAYKSVDAYDAFTLACKFEIEFADSSVTLELGDTYSTVIESMDPELYTQNGSYHGFNPTVGITGDAVERLRAFGGSTNSTEGVYSEDFSHIYGVYSGTADSAGRYMFIGPKLLAANSGTSTVSVAPANGTSYYGNASYTVTVTDSRSASQIAQGKNFDGMVVLSADMVEMSSGAGNVHDEHTAQFAATDGSLYQLVGVKVISLRNDGERIPFSIKYDDGTNLHTLGTVNWRSDATYFVALANKNTSLIEDGDNDLVAPFNLAIAPNTTDSSRSASIVISNIFGSITLQITQDA